MNVWCTLVMLGDSYAPGAAVVAATLRAAGTKYPIWCMCADVSSECVGFLREQFDNVVHVPKIEYPVAVMKSKKQNEIYGSWIRASFTKWNIFNPELFPQVSKVILVDADMMFLENCDELFDLPAPALTFSSPWSHPYMRRGVYNPYGEMRHGQLVSPTRILQGLRAGILGLACMVLVSPSTAAWEAFNKVLRREAVYGNSKCVSGFDEQAISETLLALRQPIRHIHQRFNWIVGKKNWLLHGEAPKTMQFYNQKPWNEDRHATQWQDVKDWYKMWDRIVEANADHARWLQNRTVAHQDSYRA